MATTLVLGAGMAGLAAARALRAAGNAVIMVEQAPIVGGRLATIEFGGAVFDHGAQFFTTRGAGFSGVVAAAIEAGAVREWCRGFGVDDGYPRYCGAHGMISLADWMARGVDARLGVTVDRIAATDGRVCFVDRDGLTIAEGDNAIITAPIPQTLALLHRADIKISEPANGLLRAADYFHTLALLVIVNGTHGVAEPGGVQFDSGPFTFIADNQRKGISPIPALTFHAEHDYSRTNFDRTDDELVPELLRLAAPWLGGAEVIEARVTRWRHAGPVSPLPQATEILEAAGTRIALAGDAFAGPKVEGAFNSGSAAAAALASR